MSETLGRDDAARVAQLSKGNSVRTLREVVRRAVERGEPVDPDPPLVRLQAPAAMLQHHLLTNGPPVEDAFVVSLVDDIAVPLLTTPPATPTANATSDEARRADRLPRHT